MKGIKVIDAGSNPEETQFGTCDLCFSYGVADNPYMILEFPDGEQVEVGTYDWDWGDYSEAHVKNVVDFSAWLSEQDLTDEQVAELKAGSSDTLICLISDYNFQLEDTQ